MHAGNNYSVFRMVQRLLVETPRGVVRLFFSALHSAAAVANTPLLRIQESPEKDVLFTNIALPRA
jgi:hypothetical protein